MASAMREPTTGVWEQSPQRGSGTGSGGPEAERHSLFMPQGGRNLPIVKDFSVVL